MIRFLRAFVAITLLASAPASAQMSFTNPGSSGTVANNSVTYAKMQQVGASKLLGNPTGSTANASEISLVGGLDFSGTTLRGAVNHPGYVSGNWYSPIAQATAISGGAIPSGSIRLIPFTISKPITVQALAARVATVSSGGNFQLALYANNAATGRPTGAALCSTASMSTTTATALSAAASCSAMAPGTYWEAINQDNSVAAYTTLSAGASQTSYLIGSATLANVTSSITGQNLILTVSQTFGTWPDLTSATFVETSGSTSALVFLQAT